MTTILMDSTSIDLGGALEGASSEVFSQVSAALPVALPVGAAIIAVGVAWSLFTRFVRG